MSACDSSGGSVPVPGGVSGVGVGGHNVVDDDATLEVKLELNGW